MFSGWVETMIKDIEAETKTKSTEDKSVELSATDIEKVADKVIEKLNNNSFDTETQEQETEETNAEETSVEEVEE